MSFRGPQALDDRPKDWVCPCILPSDVTKPSCIYPCLPGGSTLLGLGLIAGLGFVDVVMS